MGFPVLIWPVTLSRYTNTVFAELDVTWSDRLGIHPDTRIPDSWFTPPLNMFDRRESGIRAEPHHEIGSNPQFCIKGARNGSDAMDALFKGLASVVPMSSYAGSNESLQFAPNDHYDSRLTRMPDGSYRLHHGGGMLLSGYQTAEPPKIDMVPEHAPLIIHTGVCASQNLKLYFDDMDTEALGIDMASISTRKQANVAIDLIDMALYYALDDATTIGSYCRRLDSTESNLTASHENTTASESTLRDADMARQMAEYAKANVLTQSAQAMLAQANQSSSGVLGLLQ